MNAKQIEQLVAETTIALAPGGASDPQAAERCASTWQALSGSESLHMRRQSSAAARTIAAIIRARYSGTEIPPEVLSVTISLAQASALVVTRW